MVFCSFSSYFSSVIRKSSEIEIVNDSELRIERRERLLEILMVKKWRNNGNTRNRSGNTLEILVRKLGL